MGSRKLPFSITAGFLVNKAGSFNPPAVAGALLAAVGSGLLYTLQTNTSTSKWNVYQIICSVGVGAALQQYLITIQAILPKEEVPIGTALILFSQNLSGAIFVSVGNSVIRNQLSKGLAAVAFDDVDRSVILSAGAADFRQLLPEDLVGQYLSVYKSALKGAFLLAIPLSCLAFLGAIALEWKSLKQD
jgi:hypothetical protein